MAPRRSTMALGAGARKLSMAAGVLVWPHGVPSGWQLDGQGTTLPPGCSGMSNIAGAQAQATQTAGSLQVSGWPGG